MTTTDLVTQWSSLVTELTAHRQRRTLDEVGTDTVPVTLLAGFLGAGKSTLLSSLLSDPPGGIVVSALVNDIGSLAIDMMVADGHDLEVELTNGCGCCEQVGPLAESLDRLAGASPDQIVLEASGVADPFAMAQIVEASPLVHLDAIVTVVDAETLRSSLDDQRTGPVLRRQLDAAHLVVLSKVDLVSDTPRLIELLGHISPGRPVVCSGLDAAASGVLVAGGCRGTGPGSPLSTFLQNDFAVATLEHLEPIEPSALLSALEQPGLVRIKGYVCLGDANKPVRLDAVGRRWTMDDACAGPPALTIVATDESALARIIDCLT